MDDVKVLRLVWRDNQYKVNLPGDQAGEYVRLENYRNLEAQRNILLGILDHCLPGWRESAQAAIDEAREAQE